VPSAEGDVPDRTEVRSQESGSRGLDDPAVCVVPHHHAAGIARKALARFRGNARAVFEHGLAGLIGVGQHRGVDVNDDLIALARSSGIESLVQRRFGEEDERVRLLLGHRRRVAARLDLLVEGVPRGSKRAHEQSTGLRRQASTHDHRAVIICVDMKRAARMPSSGLAVLGLTVDAAPSAHQTLDVVRGSGVSYCQQPLFRIRSSDASHGPNLGVRDLSASKRCRQTRQNSKRARHPDALACGARIETDAPAEPRGARAEPGIPAFASVELADEIQQARGGGFEVRRKLGDRVAQPVDIRSHLHDESPLMDSTARISTDPGGWVVADRPARNDFRWVRA
jgi:hypothetical protein